MQTEFKLFLQALESYNTEAGSSILKHEVDESQRILDGTSDGQMNRVYTDTVTTAAGPLPTYDLFGSLSSILDGDIAVSLVDLNFIYVKNDEASTGNIKIGGTVGIFDDTSDQLVLPPGGIFLWWCPDAGVGVSNGATDQLVLEYVSGTVTVTTMLGGRNS